MKSRPSLPVTPAPQRKPGIVRVGFSQRQYSYGSNPSPAFGYTKRCIKRQPWQGQNESKPVTAPPMVYEVLRSSGRPLEPATRRFMESRFGHNFSQVRVHTDNKAAESAQAVNSLAYTVGRDVVFGAEQYTPYTDNGRQLLAHELTHVVQQGGAGSFPYPETISIDKPNSPLEQEAVQASKKVAVGAPTRVRPATTAVSLQGFSITTEPAGGCGICYGELYPGQGPAQAGIQAHRVIQEAFREHFPFRLVEFPFSSPTDVENYRLDLAIPTPTGFQIGEIKPATPEGEARGIKDLSFYANALFNTFRHVNPDITIEPLIMRIPVGGGLEMPDFLAQVAGCPTQRIAWIMMREGLYGYFCEPPFSQARPRCSCLGEPIEWPQEQEAEEPEEVPVPDPGLLPFLFGGLLLFLLAPKVAATAAAVTGIILLLDEDEAEASAEEEAKPEKKEKPEEEEREFPAGFEEIQLKELRKLSQDFDWKTLSKKGQVFLELENFPQSPSTIEEGEIFFGTLYSWVGKHKFVAFVKTKFVREDKTPKVEIVASTDRVTSEGRVLEGEVLVGSRLLIPESREAE